MAGVRALISSLINLAQDLLPEVKNTFFAASSSSSAQAPDAHALEADLERLMRLLERIKATLYDAEERNIRDKSVKLWLKELRELGHETKYVFEDYMYEVYRAQVEARNAADCNPQKRKPSEICAYFVKVPDGMADRIRVITSRFEEIAKDREALCLREEDAPRRHSNERQPVPTSPLVVEQSIFGREKEKEKVIDLLFSEYSNGEVISVLPIVGKGGLGKTTLAQLVYNDKRVRRRFDMSGWVWVSDDFNVETIVRHVIENFTLTGCTLTNPSVLLEKLAKEIRRKKIFLVLDDVWNEEPGLWKAICTALTQAEKAIILVTTRNVPVARIMQTMHHIQMPYLPADVCWWLFTHYAFHGIDPAKQSSMVQIGKKIVEKCCGLPLAVKSIASLLRHEADTHSWMDILQSDLWELEAGDRILAPLQISYERMPTYLKPCLLLCAMFSKDHVYDLNLMSRLWIAHGYIEREGRKDPEEVAADYAKELYERSFFDNFNTKHCKFGFQGRYNSPHMFSIRDIFTYREGRFRLHDMVHDLAWLNSEKSCYSVERGISEEMRHLYLDNEFTTAPEYLGSMNIPALQTVVVRYPREYNIPTNIMSKAEHLRALQLHGFVVEPLPLEHLKHLRYLALLIHSEYISPKFLFSRYSLRILIIDSTNYSLKEQEGIGNLINLEFLELHNISILPESLGFLRKLRVLEIYEFDIAEIPECIGNLTELHKIVLTHGGFVKLPESFCKLTKLKDLILTQCNYLKGLPEDFGNLTGLRFLLFTCPSLKHLPLSCRKLVPKCAMNVFRIKTRPDCSSGALWWLKELNGLKGCLYIKDIHNISRLEDAENANLVSKHNLETLFLDWEDKYKRNGTTSSIKWGVDDFLVTPEDYTEEKGILDISIGFPIHDTPLGEQHHYYLLENLQPSSNLKNLYIVSYGGLELPRWLGDPLSCASLVKLCINNCSNIKFLPLGKVLSLRRLCIDNCGRLIHLKRESLPNHLEHLTIKCCRSLVEVSLLQSLIKLHIGSCTALNLLSTTDGQISELDSFPSLKQMSIERCFVVKDNQILLGEDCDVHIEDCPDLKDWCLQHNFKYEVSREESCMFI